MPPLPDGRDKSMSAKRLTLWRPANVTIPTFETLMDSRSLFLTANANTSYTRMWIARNGANP
jgi:hypothetical protein